MPQVVAAVLIGAGIAASLKWLAKELTRSGEPSRVAAENSKRRDAGGTLHAPKDLGSLEWDAEAGVYRPSARHPG